MTSSIDQPVGGRHRRVATPRRNKRERAALVLAVLCLPVAAAAIVFLAVTPSSSPSASSGSLLSGTSRAGLAAAKIAVPTILSYDYRSIGSDIAKAKAVETGVFAKQYTQVAQPLLAQARRIKAIVQATVGSAGVVSEDHDNVVVLLFVDQATVRQDRNQPAPQTRIDQDRVLATMTKVNGRWFVSALAAL
jgi:Mce-associated membrane protein